MSVRSAPHRTRSVLTTLALAALTIAGSATSQVAVADTAPPAGTAATVSADGLPTWQINGVVWSQAVVGNVVYATGSFTKARPPGVAAGGAGEVDALNIFAYDITTGNRVASFSHALNAQGRVVVASPDGSRIYVGGDFTAVDGNVRGHVAAFDTATGALSTAITPSVSNQVRALAATSSTLFIGGGYSRVNTSARKNLSAISTADGSLLPWAPTADDGDVWSMVVTPDQSRVVVGGAFTTLNGQANYGMGSLSTGTGANQPWAANLTIRDAGANGAITSLRTDGRQIYGSGFSFGGGTNFEGTFAADPTTGKISVVNDCHGDTYDVLPVASVLYSVGHAHDCTPIASFPDTSPRVRWQRALAQTISPTRTNSGPDSYGWNYSGLPASDVLQWFPKIASGSYTGQYQGAWSLAGNGTYVVLGGEFPQFNGTAQQGLVRTAVAASAPNRRGPTYTTQPETATPATTASAPSAGTASVTFGTAWDYDNETLTYELLRDGGTTPVKTTQLKSNFWTLPKATLVDSGVPAGAHTYRVRIKDPFGNSLLSPVSNSVTTTGTANATPTASFLATPSGLSVTVDGSGSSDPDGTISSHKWTFGDGGTATGATATHSYAAAGTYTVTLTVTDNAGATDSTTKAVTVAAGQTSFARDQFSRTTSSGWGSADQGGAWTGSGTSTNFAVTGGVGTIRMGAAGSGPSMALNGVSATDTDVRLTVGADKAATGGGIYTTVSPRIRATGDKYYADTRFVAGGSVSLILGRVAGGTDTALVTRTVSGLTVTPTDRLNVAVQARGTAPTTVQAKVWKVGDPEPATWTSSVTDSTAALQGPGAIGVDTYLSGSATNAPVVASFDDLTAGPPA